MTGVKEQKDNNPRRVRAVKTDGCITIGKVYVVKQVNVFFVVEDDHETTLLYPDDYFEYVDSGRQPNHDVQGNPLSGQDVNYDLTSGDTFVIDNVRYLVTETYPDSVMAINLATKVEGYWSYEALRRRWARYD